LKPHAWIAVGALSGALTVALGAFGAHALKESVTPEDLAIWQTAVHYQGLHALALVLFGTSQQVRPRACIGGWAFLLGSAIFAGTLYAMVLGGPRWLGAITPIGGTLLIVGWLSFAWSAWRAR
jgi:uncharacterized membrane protein YgdD (TMEM256/DUF423 family)